MANEKTVGRWKRFVFKLLGPVRSREILANAVRKQTAGDPAFSFPLDVGAIKSVLIILPSEKLQVLHQLRNLFELAAYFKPAKITLLAETACAPLAGLIEGVTVVEYPLESKKLFSAALTELNMRFKSAFDVCCLLTRTEDMVLLNCTGRTGAPLRIGYAKAGGQPFLNLHVNPSAERVLESDWNCAMAEMLGAKQIRHQKWEIAKQTAHEIDHLLKDHHFSTETHPTGIDALCFYRKHGEAWADGCVKALLPCVKTSIYLYAEETNNAQEIAWLEHFKLPVLANLSIPQIAALTARSGLVVTGNTLFFGLASLFASHVVGIFESNEIAANCPVLPAVQGIVYEKAPGAETIEKTVKAIAGLTTVP